MKLHIIVASLFVVLLLAGCSSKPRTITESSNELTDFLSACEPDIQYGRSHYNAEKVAKKQCGIRRNVCVVQDEWPYEVFRSACIDNDDFEFLEIACEWGHCELVEPMEEMQP